MPTKTTATVSYDEVVAALTANVDPVTFVFCNRMLFHRRDQFPAESVSAYTASLRKLAANCDFGKLNSTTRMYDNSSMLPLNVVMRARILCSHHDRPHKQGLFAEEDLSFKMAYHISLAAQSSSNDT